MFVQKIKKLHSMLKYIPKNKYRYECIKISLTYLMIGLLWIYFSDRFTYKIADNGGMLLILNTYKGWLYVIASAVIIYLLISKFMKKVELSEKKLNESYDELSAVNEELQAYVQQLTASEEEMRLQYEQLAESEKKLKASEERTNAIIKVMPDLLFLIDESGIFIDSMAGNESLLLLPKEAFIGKSLFDVMPKEISEEARERMQTVLKHGIVESFKYELNLYGQKRHFELRMVRKNEKEIIAISRDVTVERQQELALKLSEERFKTLVSTMQQGLALYEGSPEEDVRNYRFLDANEAHERLTGINTKENSGKTVGQLLPNLENEILEKLNHVVKTGQFIQYQHYFQPKGNYYEIVAYQPQKSQLAVIVYDITEKRQAEDTLKANEYTLRTLFKGSSDAIFIAENNFIIDCNLSAIELLGHDSIESILGKGLEQFAPENQPDGEDSKEKFHKMTQCAMAEGKSKFEWWYMRVDGSVLPVEIMMTSILLHGKNVLHSSWRDIKDRKQMESRMKYLSYHDQLTGLYNRRFFEEELDRLDVEENLPFTLIMADVNGLKLVNDSFGHNVGDELLKTVVEVMTKGCGNNRTIARLAGDEFVIMLPKTDADEVEQLIQNMKDLASKEKVGSVEISISFGYEVKRIMEEKISEVLKKAEDYMYKKKLFESPSMRGKTINAIITALHEKNKREEQHSHRVSKLCESMGRALDLSEDKIKELRTVGLLHDIGKIAIEESILNKAGKLTEEEWKTIKRHPEIGYRILSTVNDMSEMAEYVLAHHEKWNGTGYPKGLRCDGIPLQSRIITIADAYDAMVSERSYRNPLTEEAALQELKINSGIQFDAELVKIFIEKVLYKTFN